MNTLNFFCNKDPEIRRAHLLNGKNVDTEAPIDIRNEVAGARKVRRAGGNNKFNANMLCRTALSSSKSLCFRCPPNGSFSLIQSPGQALLRQLSRLFRFSQEAIPRRHRLFALVQLRSQDFRFSSGRIDALVKCDRRRICFGRLKQVEAEVGEQES